MKQQVLFIHGGDGKEDHEADAKLVASLREGLGEGYEILYPLLPNDASADFGRKKQIGEQLSLIGGEVILAGHSLGASMLLKYLSETTTPHDITGIFLLATPFWSGPEDWKQGFILQTGFAERLPKAPIFLYHCRDDEEVPIEHFGRYAKALPQATLREITTGGHQFGNDLSVVVEDMRRCGKGG
jgi:uncharacterized protein